MQHNENRASLELHKKLLRLPNGILGSQGIAHRNLKKRLVNLRFRQANRDAELLVGGEALLHRGAGILVASLLDVDLRKLLVGGRHLRELASFPQQRNGAQKCLASRAVVTLGLVNLRRHEQVVTASRRVVRFFDVEPGLLQIDGRVGVTTELRVHTTDNVQSLGELCMLAAFPLDLEGLAVIGQSLPQISRNLIDLAEIDEHERIRALEAGEFYGSSGVTLDDVQASGDVLSFVIQEEDGIDYVTQFIGTRRGYDRTTEEVHAEDASVLYRYSEAIGEVLATVSGGAPSYTFRGDELYVRAKVVSSKLKDNPYKEGEFEAAWIQPVVGVRAR